jgi:hypothetical protein
VTDGTDVYALSNNHVYADINQAELGDNVLQPGSYDGGLDPGDAIGTLHAYEPIRLCYYWWFWLICEQTNTMDAAIALSSEDKLSCSTPDDGYGTPGSAIHSAYGDPDIIGDENLDQLLGLGVKKYGRTTGQTVGAVDAINASVNVCYDQECSNVARFTDQLIITPGGFSGGGDSGSLIVTHDEANTPVALLFAGSDTNTIANRIDLVLNHFGVTVDSRQDTPVTDIALTDVAAPSSVVAGELLDAEVSVENVGTEPVTSDIYVTLRSDNATPDNESDDISIQTQSIGSLGAGEIVSLTFSWDTSGADPGNHTLTASHDLGDDDASNNSADGVITVLTPATDLAVAAISTPSSIEQGETGEVTVTIQNLGNQDVGSFTVTLDDTTDLTSQSQDVPGLGAGMTADFVFSWDTADASIDSHTLEASHDLNDDDSTNDMQTTTVNVVEPAVGPMLRTGQVTAYTDRWTTVTVCEGCDYGQDMVVVCSPNYDLGITAPTVVHVRNASNNSFQVMLSPAVYGTFQDWQADVRWIVVKAGVYDLAGIKMEAGKFDSPTTAARKNWVADPVAYQQDYANPVVLGQVMSYNSGLWSVFWSRGASAASPPSASVCQVGKHVGEDLDPRGTETIGYVVIEAGSGTVDGRRYAAAVGPDTVRGMGNSPPDTYSLDLDFIPSTAIVSQVGMDGGNGGWPVLYGEGFLTATGLDLAIEEDWYWDSERAHTTEQVSYIVME